MAVAFVPKTSVITVGRVFFAVGMIVIGSQHFIFRQFVPEVVPIPPHTIPAQLVWVYLTGAVLITSGISILTTVKAHFIATLLGGVFLCSFILFHWQANANAGLKALTLAGCAFVVADTFPRTASGDGHKNPMAWLEKFIPCGMYLLAFQVIIFGRGHFLHNASVATLVPAWIPDHAFWTYFAGAALIASGLAMIVGVNARLAATLLGAMIFTWVLILHIPRAFADPGQIGHEWTSAFEALSKSGVAFILGETLGEHGK